MFLKQIQVMSEEVSGIILSDAQILRLASYIDEDKKQKNDIIRAVNTVSYHSRGRDYEIYLVYLNPNSNPYLSAFMHPSPNPDGDYEYLMIALDSLWEPAKDTASTGDAERDEIGRKEIRSWISQSTEGQIVEEDLLWLTIPETLIVTGGGRSRDALAEYY